MSQTTNLGKVCVTPKGAHDPTITYAILDIVTDNGSSYIAVKDVPVNIQINNTTYWQCIAAKGNTGEITEVTASISGGYGTPGVTVTEGGTTTEKTLAFAFTNLVGSGISSIVGEKTGTSGAVDTYTLTITYESGDTDTVTYTVTNGSVTSVNGKTGDVVLGGSDIKFESYDTDGFILGGDKADSFKNGFDAIEESQNTNQFTYSNTKSGLRATNVQDAIDETVNGLKSGQLVPAKATLAENLTPYSDESGNTQTNPFAFQATGTDNGENTVDTGTYCLLKEKRGHSEVVDGTLVDSAAQYLKCARRQQWDEEWEAGYIDLTTGQNAASSSNIRSKNYIRIKPNTAYYIKAPATPTYINVCYYDESKNRIGAAYPSTNNATTTPAGAYFMRFYCEAAYGATYNNDITISFYYEGESGYDKYYPYTICDNVNTGTETLRSAGTNDAVYDVKVPNGTIIRNVGTRAYQAGDENDSTLTTDGTTTNYPLETPTTETGTAFKENATIDDFGSMQWVSENGLPQGSEIFYPVDYKAMIDSLNNLIEGDVDDLVTKDEVPSAPASDGTYTLKVTVSDGTATYSWVADSQ